MASRGCCQLLASRSILYADVVIRPPARTPASRFLMVPLASWALMALAMGARRITGSSGAGRS